MLHLRDKGYRCCYPVPTSVTRKRTPYSVQMTEKALAEYVRYDRGSLDDAGCESEVNSEQNVFDVLILVYVQGQPMGTMKTPPSEQLLYSTGQYVGGIDNTLQVVIGIGDL